MISSFQGQMLKVSALGQGMCQNDSTVARGKRLRTHIEQYAREKRGMDFHHDVRDWIGGYPYESIAPGELKQMLGGFDLVREKSRRRSGLFGSGNDEYLFRKR